MKQRNYDQIEEAFHDKWASEIDVSTVDVFKYFTAPTAIEGQYILSKMGNLKGKKILDLGCGFGEASVYFALKGAKVTSLDLSEKMIECVKSLSKKYNVVSSINTLKSKAEKIPLKNDSFDIIFGGNVLHHTDVKAVSREIKRVLKPKGKAFFIEPLAYNPMINIYRIMAREVRTKTEKPFSLKKIDEMCVNFKQFSHCEFQLFTVFIFVWFFLVERLNPGKVRYWKKYIEEGEKYSRPFRILNYFDNIILKIPFFRRFCWNTVIELIK